MTIVIILLVLILIVAFDSCRKTQKSLAEIRTILASDKPIGNSRIEPVDVWAQFYTEYHDTQRVDPFFRVMGYGYSVAQERLTKSWEQLQAHERTSFTMNLQTYGQSIFGTHGTWLTRISPAGGVFEVHVLNLADKDKWQSQEPSPLPGYSYGSYEIAGFFPSISAAQAGIAQFFANSE